MKKVYLLLWRIKNKIYKSETIKILKTSYGKQVFDIPLNKKFYEYQSSKVKVVSQTTKWMILEIPEMRFFWPKEYDLRGLDWIHAETFAPFKKNPHAYETSNVRICPGDWVVDAGACEGFFVKYSLSRKANVLAIEPVPQLANALRKTYSTEIKAGKVIVLNAGLGNKNSNEKLLINPQNVYCSSVSNYGIQVPIYSIDNLIRQGIVPTIDFIKMDIEGAEVDAIFGATEILGKQPKLSIAVYHSYKNALLIRNFVRREQIKYRVSFRGIYTKDKDGPPRPYMLHAY